MKNNSNSYYNPINEIINEFSDDIVLGTAATFHDIGKLFTEEKNDEGHSIYYGHAQVGTYYLLQNLDVLNVLGMRSADIIKCLFYIIYYH